MRKITEIRADIENIPNLYKERDEAIMILHANNYSAAKIAALFGMKRQNVSSIIIKFSRSAG